MSSTYTVKSGDTLGQIYVNARQKDKNLSWDRFIRANKHIKNPDTIMVQEIINIPKIRKRHGCITAEPKEGKCGNEVILIPIGNNALKVSAYCKINNKTTPKLEANETFILEKDKLEESQQGEVEINIDGKNIKVDNDLSKYKDQISKHKDVKLAIVLIDEELLTTAKKTLNYLEKPVEGMKPKMNVEYDNGHYTLVKNDGKTISMVHIDGEYTSGDIGEITAPHAYSKGSILKRKYEGGVGGGWNTFSAKTKPLKIKLYGTTTLVCTAKGNVGGLGFNARIKADKKGFGIKIGGTLIVGGGLSCDIKF